MRNPRKRHIVGRDRHDVAIAIAANFRAGLADERERFVDDDRPGVNAGLDANGLVRRGRIDPFLQRRGSRVR